MINLLVIVFFLALFVVLIFHSIVHIMSFFKEQETLEKFKLDIAKEINSKGYKIISIDKPNSMYLAQNPFNKDNDFFTSGFFPSGNQTFYRIIRCLDKESKEKIIWLEIYYSFYSNSFYKLSGLHT